MAQQTPIQAPTPSADQQLLNDFLSVPKHYRKKRARDGQELFSVFNHDHVDKVLEMNERFEDIMNSQHSFRAVVEEGRREMERDESDNEIVQFAMGMFVTRNRETRTHLVIPPLVQRYPRALLRHRFSKFGPQGSAEAENRRLENRLAPASPPEVTSDQEKLAWWLEDPMLNEHHEHWHMIFISDIYQDRHGELFFYMHGQMLARYDAERKAVGKDRVVPYDNFAEQVEGYTPYKELRQSGSSQPFFARALNDRMDSNDAAQLTQMRSAIAGAVNANQYVTASRQTRTLDADSLGIIVESSSFNKTRNQQPPDSRNPSNQYGSFHGMGHGAISSMSGAGPGVMSNPRTACRDPIFWRWHRNIDNIYADWLTRHRQPHTFTDAPPVQVKGVTLANLDQLLQTDSNGLRDHYASFGERQFGGAKFDTPVTSTSHPFTTDELNTKIKTREFDWPEDSRRNEQIKYVYPREWYYFIRLANSSNKTAPVTVRIFIAPEEFADQRELWIEMDKFSQDVPAGGRVVIARPCEESAVIRKAAAKTPQQMDVAFTRQGPGRTYDRYCDCGWPFNLLLPRGSRDGRGTKYTMFVIVTDANIDRPLGANSRCGSVSFCGGNPDTNVFPDKRNMGYPFDAPFARVNGKPSFKASFQSAQSAFIRDVYLREVDNFPDVPVN